jgi:hypothetical protein
MELGPIAGIRAVSPVMAAHVEREVQPPFALDGAGRMEDDGYNGAAREETERGLEEEDAEMAADDSPEEDRPGQSAEDGVSGSMDEDSTDEDLMHSDSTGSDGRVNLFA